MAQRFTNLIRTEQIGLVELQSHVIKDHRTTTAGDIGHAMAVLEVCLRDNVSREVGPRP
jgi:hypothetical protein